MNVGEQNSRRQRIENVCFPVATLWARNVSGSLSSFRFVRNNAIALARSLLAHLGTNKGSEGMRLHERTVHFVSLSHVYSPWIIPLLL